MLLRLKCHILLHSVNAIVIAAIVVVAVCQRLWQSGVPSGDGQSWWNGRWVDGQMCRSVDR